MTKLAFVDRCDELKRLDTLATRGQAGLAIVSGRRRIGKTRLLLEWVERHGGLYTVADTSTPEIQRRYLAESLAMKLPGFADVSYPDWGALLARVARDASAHGWTGPIVFDELPYLLVSSPELPSILQRWLDHDGRRAGLVVALAGSSQRMMLGLGLAPSSPLFGRADEVLELHPLEPRFLERALKLETVTNVVETYTALGGVPRYWELAFDRDGPVADVVDQLVLDPRGTLHKEPDFVLIEEVPPAVEVRPLLDAIGAGAHRVSEIGARIGRKATSLSRPLDRLVSMKLVQREVPFGENEKRSKRSLYKLADPFFRLWFRIVAPNRALLASSSAPVRKRLLKRYWPALVSAAWEDLCRSCLPRLKSGVALDDWGPGGRWWHGNAPEWDVVALSVDEGRVLLGEAKWKRKPFTRRQIETSVRALHKRKGPALQIAMNKKPLLRALFVPATEDNVPDLVDDVVIVRGDSLLSITE